MKSENKIRFMVALVVFVLAGMIGIFAVSQAYGDDNANIQVANANAYSAVPSTFSYEDLMNQMQAGNDAIANGNVNTSSNAVGNVSADSIEEKVDQVISEYEQNNPGTVVTNEGRQQLIQLFKDEEIKHYNYNSPSTSSSNYSTFMTTPSQPSVGSGTAPSGNNSASQIVLESYRDGLQYVVENNSDATAQAATSRTEDSGVASAPIIENGSEPVIQNIEAPATPENAPQAQEQQVQQSAVQSTEANTNREPRVVDPLISRAIEDNVAAAATVTSTEPVIIEKEPTRGAGLFGEDGLIAQIVSNPVLRAGIAAFPILIIILIAGFMISRKNEE